MEQEVTIAAPELAVVNVYPSALEAEESSFTANHGSLELVNIHLFSAAEGRVGLQAVDNHNVFSMQGSR